MKKTEQGVGLIELMLALAIVGVAALLFATLARLIPQLNRQAMMAKMEEEARVTLYTMAHEVRNARSILHVSSDTLAFTTLDLTKSLDVNQNTNLFVNVGTVTYRYQPGSDNYVLKTVEFGGNPTGTKLLRNILVRPDMTNFLFEPQTCPCERISIAIRMNPGYFRRAPRVYRQQATIRSYSGQT